MSRAFVKEDVDLPERSGRKRSASGLPPGATNYITARGAKRLQDELQKLRAANANSEHVAELEQILASVHVVDPPDPASNSVAFGATVTVQDKKGRTETYAVVGVDELDLEPDAVSWISPIGKTLLAADMGDWITLEDGRAANIVKIERKSVPWKLWKLKRAGPTKNGRLLMKRLISLSSRCLPVRSSARWKRAASWLS